MLVTHNDVVAVLRGNTRMLSASSDKNKLPFIPSEI